MTTTIQGDYDFRVVLVRLEDGSLVGLTAEALNEAAIDEFERQLGRFEPTCVVEVVAC